MDKKLLTIIVSTYNRPLLLKRLLKSIFQSEFNYKIQVNVIDDNSSISYKNEIQEFYKYENFHYFKLNKNLYKIKNIYSLKDKINSEFVLIADDKDYFIDSGIKKIVNFLEKNIGKICVSYHFNKKKTGILGKPIKGHNSLWKHMYKLGHISDRFIYVPYHFFKNTNIDFSQFKEQKVYGEFLIYENIINEPTFSFYEPVSFHEYLKNGITGNLLELKTENWIYTMYCINYILSKKPCFKVAIQRLTELYNIKKKIKVNFNFRIRYKILFYFLNIFGIFILLNHLYKVTIRKLIK